MITEFACEHSSSRGSWYARIQGCCSCFLRARVGIPTLHAEPVEDFYRKNTITLSIGLEEGGGYDIMGRLIGRYIGRYIPGNPQVIVQNQTGAGGLVLANSLYNVDKRDGSALGVLNETVALSQQVGDKGVKYDASKFSWIGRMASGAEAVVVASRTGVRTLEDATSKQVWLSATGQSGTSTLFPMVLNSIAHTKFKIVLGYPGMSSTWVATERGRDRGGSNSLVSIKSTKPNWLRDGSMNFLVQVGLTRDQSLPDTPLLSEVGATDFDREVLKLVSSPAASILIRPARKSQRTIADARLIRPFTTPR